MVAMNIIQFEQNLIKARDLATLEKCLADYLESLGISVYSFTYYSYSAHVESKIKYDFSSEKLKIWHAHYMKEKYDEVDSTLDEVYQEVFPIYWTLEKQLREAKSGREKKMRLDSIEFGMERGISVPVHGPNNDLAILMVAKKRGERFTVPWGELKWLLHSIAHCFYSYLRAYLLKNTPSEDQGRSRFSKRELQCLTLVAQNCSVATIAKKLSITERTVNYHIQNVNKKLGTHSKYQSVAKALKQGLINV